MAIVTYPLNNVDYDASGAAIYNCTRTSGVYADENNLDISITDDMVVSIGTGLAWIRNTAFAGMAVAVKNAVAVAVGVADSVLNRIDRVVLQYSAANNASSVVLKPGTPSSSPTAPARITTESLYELVLYDIYVAAGTTMLTESMITDQRRDTGLCGLMADGVTREGAITYVAVDGSSVTSLSIADNTQYDITAAATMALAFPADAAHWHAHIFMTMDAGGTYTVTFPNGTKYLNNAPTWVASTKYEIDIMDGVVIFGEVTAA